MISLDQTSFRFVEEDGFPENTILNRKVALALQKIKDSFSGIEFYDFDVTVKLSGQLYNSRQPFRFVEYEIYPDFTPDDIHTQIETILKMGFDSCLNHLR